MTFEALFNMFVVFFVVLDPVGLAAIFGGLTNGGDDAYRRRMAIRGTLLAAGILLFFAITGDDLLRIMGISVPAFKIAGGLLLFLLAIDMVFARQSGLRSATQREQREAREKSDIAVFPLAFPLLAGPGALTSVLLILGDAQGNRTVFWAMLGVLTVVLSLVLTALLLAGHIMRLLGETGANVIDRLLGVILSALAVQFILEGLATFLADTQSAAAMSP